MRRREDKRNTKGITEKRERDKDEKGMMKRIAEEEVKNKTGCEKDASLPKNNYSMNSPDIANNLLTRSRCETYPQSSNARGRRICEPVARAVRI